MNHEQIAVLAYRLWQERGCPDGSAELDWERAEVLLREGAAPESESHEVARTEESDAPRTVNARPRRDQVSARGQGSPTSRH